MSKRITSLTALTTPKDDMELIVYDQDDSYDKKINYANLMKPLTGSGVPAITPDFIGQRYIDTTGNREYFAVATASSADWRKVARYDYGTVTVTGGGGDVTVNLDFDWTDGRLYTYRSQAPAAEYCNDDIVETTYDSLTNGSFTADHITYHVLGNVGDFHFSPNKTTNARGAPKAATTNSFTLDDDGATTLYVKWFIIS